MAKYLRYIIRNIEPLRIADDSVSQRGQTATLQYIPGSTIRGLVINALSADSRFAQMKKRLFSNRIRFLNAYPLAELRTESNETMIKELIPSPKGFYEHKGEPDVSAKKAIENSIVNDNFSEYGLKKADIGKYCYIENGCICYLPIRTGSDMKINMNRQKEEKQYVFRNEYIMPGYCFAGYIAIEEVAEKCGKSAVLDEIEFQDNSIATEELADKIKGVFSGQIILGNARSAGMGKCIVEDCGFYEYIPYSEYKDNRLLSGKCYMMLLSNAVMRDEYGEYCGLDKNVLAKHLGVKNLKIEQCATSAVEVKGFNRTWKCKIPSVFMYEQGSVFRLSFHGRLTGENISKLMDQGIGIRRNEGFGRIIFLKDYDQIYEKQEKSMVLKLISFENCLNDDEVVLKIVAKCHYRNLIERAIGQYIVENPLKTGEIANSQLGQIEALAVSYQYIPDKAFEEIKNFFLHTEKKEKKNNIQKEQYSMGVFSKSVLSILDNELESFLEIGSKNPDQIMGIAKSDLLNKEETCTLKLHLLSSWIRYYNKQEKRGE